MTDIVRILETYAESKGFIFHYGNTATQNLIETGEEWTGAYEDIYLLLAYRSIQPRTNATKTNLTGTDYTGNFFLVKHSDIDQNFFQEVGEQADGKYTNNIEPLLLEIPNMVKHFGCSDVDFTITKIDDVTDYLDANADGLLIYFTAFVPSYYNLTNGSS